MTIKDFFHKLFALQSSETIPFLVIGGHAINAYTHVRTTYDLDILMAEDSLEALKAELTTWKMKFEGRTTTFARFKLLLPDSAPYTLDVMLVNSATFKKLYPTRILQKVGAYSYSVPAPEHLIALKLHALQNEARKKKEIDYTDIQQLIRGCGLSLSDPKLKEVIQRYAPSDIKARLEEEF